MFFVPQFLFIYFPYFIISWYFNLIIYGFLWLSSVWEIVYFLFEEFLVYFYIFPYSFVFCDWTVYYLRFIFFLFITFHSKIKNIAGGKKIVARGKFIHERQMFKELKKRNIRKCIMTSYFNRNSHGEEEVTI